MHSWASGGARATQIRFATLMRGCAASGMFGFCSARAVQLTMTVSRIKNSKCGCCTTNRTARRNRLVGLKMYSDDAVADAPGGRTQAHVSASAVQIGCGVAARGAHASATAWSWTATETDVRPRVEDTRNSSMSCERIELSDECGRGAAGANPRDPTCEHRRGDAST